MIRLSMRHNHNLFHLPSLSHLPLVPGDGRWRTTSLVIKKSLSTVIFEPFRLAESWTKTTIPRRSVGIGGDAKPETMTLLHINFPPRWLRSLILFADRPPHSTLIPLVLHHPMLAQETALLPPAFIFRLPGQFYSNPPPVCIRPLYGKLQERQL